jgi:hypothetical protein
MPPCGITTSSFSRVIRAVLLSTRNDFLSLLIPDVFLCDRRLYCKHMLSDSVLPAIGIFQPLKLSSPEPCLLYLGNSLM